MNNVHKTINADKKYNFSVIIAAIITGIFVLITGYYTGPRIGKKISEGQLIAALNKELISDDIQGKKYALFAVKIGVSENVYNDFVSLVATDYFKRIVGYLSQNKNKEAEIKLSEAEDISGDVYNRVQEELTGFKMDNPDLAKNINDLLNTGYELIPILMDTTSGVYVEYLKIKSNSMKNDLNP